MICLLYYNTLTHPSNAMSQSNQSIERTAPHRTFPRTPPQLQLLVLVFVPPSAGSTPFSGPPSGRVGHDVGLDPSLLGYRRHRSWRCPRFAIATITARPGRAAFRPVSEHDLEGTEGGRRRRQETGDHGPQS